jgi:hypothetical protein
MTGDKLLQRNIAKGAMISEGNSPLSAGSGRRRITLAAAIVPKHLASLGGLSGTENCNVSNSWAAKV